MKHRIPSRNGLVGEWKLDGNAIDTSGSGFNGTPANVTYGTTYRGYQSQTGVFNGSSAYVDCGNVISSTTGTLSILFAFKSSATGTNKVFIGRRGNNGGNDNINYMVYIEAGGALSFYFTSSNGAAYERFAATSVTNSTLSDGKPHFIEVQHTWGSSSSFKFKLDGVDIAGSWVVWGNGTPDTNANMKLAIGASYTSSFSNFIAADMQSFRVFTQALSEDTIFSYRMEFLRKLGGGSFYPLLDGLVSKVSFFGSTTAVDEIIGRNDTYVWGTLTTDNFGSSNAISNPNYTWTSVTYTTGYTFENSVSWWGIVTTPSGLSATGINRTTTLRDIFLFNRTLSASEVTALENSCKNEYVIPFA
jgi:hypothetical protein